MPDSRLSGAIPSGSVTEKAALVGDIWPVCVETDVPPPGLRLDGGIRQRYGKSP